MAAKHSHRQLLEILVGIDLQSLFFRRSGYLRLHIKFAGSTKRRLMLAAPKSALSCQQAQA